MLKNPILAIVGRPNVGKSALFNRLAGRRVSIVDEEEGVTRDRVYATASCYGYEFRLIDTGGIDVKSQDGFAPKIKEQAEKAIEEADAICMVVDGRVGLTAQDAELAKMLHKAKRPFTLAVNKIDDASHEYLLAPFYALGCEKIVPISALHGSGIEDLLRMSFKGLKISKRKIVEEKAHYITVVGRPNVGKSTLLNALLGEERVVVSPIAGTTRDAIDVPFTVGDKKYVLVDTAGIRRKKSEREVVDKFAFVRTEAAIERSDCCLLVLDAEEGLTSYEKRIAQMLEEKGKGCLLILNKWDLIKGYRMEHCRKFLQIENPFLAHAPLIFASGKTGRNVDQIFPEIEKLLLSYQKKMTTGSLNKFLERTMQLHHPPMIDGKRLRIYYMTQVGTSPPRFLLFINKKALLCPSYKKYLENQFRAAFHLNGIPLSFQLKEKEERAIWHQK